MGILKRIFGQPKGIGSVDRPQNEAVPDDEKARVRELFEAEVARMREKNPEMTETAVRMAVSGMNLDAALGKRMNKP